MIVMARSQDHVEAINSTLRKAGHPVHCTWLSDASDLGDALTQLNPEMLIAFTDELSVDLASIMKVKQQNAPGMPVLIVRETVDEAAIADAMRLGCQDVVTLANRSRLQAVASRELRAHRLERALSSTLIGARISRAAAKLSRRFRRCHHACAGRHHRGRQPRLGRAVRLLRERRPQWLADHGFVRTRDAPRPQRGAGRVPARQVERPRTESAGAALGRLDARAGIDADAGRLRE